MRTTKRSAFFRQTVWLTALCVLTTAAGPLPVLALAPPSTAEKFQEMLDAGRLASHQSERKEAFPLTIQGFFDAAQKPIARAAMQQGVVNAFSILPAEDGSGTEMNKARDILEAYKGDAKAFRARRLTRFLNWLLKRDSQGKPVNQENFFQDARIRLNDLITEIREDFKAFGLALPEAMILEVHAGLGRFSSMHKDNGDLHIAVDLELLQKRIPKEVLRFFLTHELLHAALGAQKKHHDRSVNEIGVMLLNLAMAWKNDDLEKVTRFFDSLAKPHAFGLAAARKLAADTKLAGMLARLARMRKGQEAYMRTLRRPNLKEPERESIKGSLTGLQRKAFAQIVDMVQEWIRTDSDLRTDHPQTEWLFAKLKESFSLKLLSGIDSEVLMQSLSDRHQEATRRLLHQLISEEKLKNKQWQQWFREGKPLLLVGEDGLHKHLLAQHIHQVSKGAGAPFRMLDAMLLKPGTLAEKLKPGSAWRQAVQGGTLYIHRPEMLQPQDAEALAGISDIRFIYSTADAERLSPDMYFRLGIGHHVCDILALRDRTFADKDRIFRHMLEKFRVLEGMPPMRFSPEATRKLAEYSWPGNIFECESVIHRAVLLAHGPQIERWDVRLRPEGIAWDWRLAGPLMRSRLNVLIEADSERSAGKFVRRMLAYEDGGTPTVLEVDAREWKGRNLGLMLHGDEQTGQPGLLDRARGGAIVLHNVEELSPRAQKELMRMLLLGGFQDELTGEPEAVNVRWFFTTKLGFKALKALFDEEKFLPDLSFWIDQFPVMALPLKQRRDAIAETVQDMLKVLAQQAGRAPPALDRQAQVLLNAYPWMRAGDLEAALARALEKSLWQTVKPEHLDPELQLDAQIVTDIADGTGRDGLAAEYFGEETWGLARAAVSPDVLKNTVVANPASIASFAEGMRALKLMPTLQFPASEIPHGATTDEENIRWLHRAFSGQTVQALWEQRRLLALMRYFYEGRGREEDLNAIVAEMEQYHPALKEHFDAYRGDADRLRIQRLTFLRMQRLLFQLHLMKPGLRIPSHSEILELLGSDIAMEQYLLGQTIPHVSRQAADHLQRRLSEMAHIAQDWDVPEGPLSMVKDLAVKAHDHRTEYCGVIVKAQSGERVLSAYFPLLLEKPFPRTLALGQPGELARAIAQWAKVEMLDTATVEAVACVRVAPSEADDLIPAWPHLSDFTSWNGDVRQDERRVVETALRLLKARSVEFKDMPVILAQAEGGIPYLAAYHILNVETGALLMKRMHERIQETMRPGTTWKEALKQWAQSKDPLLLAQEKAVEPLALCYGKARILPPFSKEEAWRSAPVPALPDKREQALLELLLHPKDNEFLVPMPRDPKTGMILEKDLAKDKEELWAETLQGMALESQGQIEGVFQNVGAELSEEQEQRLSAIIFERPTVESKNFMTKHYPDRTPGDMDPLRAAVESMFRDLLANRRADPARAKKLALLFAKVYALLLRQNEADLELKFGNNHNAQHDMTLLNIVEAFVEKNPLITETVLKTHYGPEAMALLKLTILLHDVGYVEYVQRQRQRFREGVTDLLPKKVHSALSVHVVDTQLKELLDEALGIGADKPHQPGRSIYEDILEAILYHSVSKDKEKGAVYDEKRNPLLFLVTLADKLDFMKTRVKKNFMEQQGLLPAVEDYLATVNLQGPKPHRREELRAMIIRLKQESPEEYTNFKHSYSTLGVKGVRLRLKLENRYISGELFQKLPDEQKAKVRLSIWTQIDHYAVDLTKGIEEDEANNPALLQTVRVRHAMHPFDFNNAKVECDVSLHPQDLPAEEYAPPRIPVREEVLREVQRLFPNVAAGPDDLALFELAATSPDALKNLLGAVQNMLKSLMPPFHSAFLDDSKTAYPFVLGLANNIEVKDLLQAMHRRLDELVPAHVPPKERGNYLNDHLIEFDAWDAWAKRVTEDLLVRKGKFHGPLEDVAHWHAFQGPDQLTGVFSHMLGIVKQKYPGAINEIAVLQQDFPPHTMCDMAKALHREGWTAHVRGMALPEPLHWLTFPDGEIVMAERDGHFVAANISATRAVRQVKDLEHRINVTAAKLSIKIQAEADLHEDAWRKEWQTKVQTVNIEAQQVLLSDMAADQKIHRLKELAQRLGSTALIVDGDFDTTHLLHEQRRWDVLEDEWKEKVARILEPTPPEGRSDEKTALSAMREGVRIEIKQIQPLSLMHQWVSEIGHGQYADRMEFDAQATWYNMRKRRVPPGRSQVLVDFNSDRELHPFVVSPLLPEHGLYFRGFGLRERRASEAVEKARRWGAAGPAIFTEELAFVQYQKTAPGVLTPQKITWGIATHRKGNARLPLEEIKRLLSEQESKALMPVLLRVNKALKEHVIVDEASKREALRHTAVLLAQEGIEAAMDEKSGLISLERNAAGDAWGTPAGYGAVAMLSHVLRESQQPVVLQEALKTLQKMFIESRDYALRRQVIAALEAVMSKVAQSWDAYRQDMQHAVAEMSRRITPEEWEEIWARDDAEASWKKAWQGALVLGNDANAMRRIAKPLAEKYARDGDMEGIERLWPTLLSLIGRMPDAPAAHSLANTMALLDPLRPDARPIARKYVWLQELAFRVWISNDVSLRQDMEMLIKAVFPSAKILEEFYAAFTAHFVRKALAGEHPGLKGPASREQLQKAMGDIPFVGMLRKTLAGLEQEGTVHRDKQGLYSLSHKGFAFLDRLMEARKIFEKASEQQLQAYLAYWQQRKAGALGLSAPLPSEFVVAQGLHDNILDILQEIPAPRRQGFENALHKMLVRVDRIRAARFPGLRGTMSPERLQEIMAEDNFKVLLETRLSTDSAETGRPAGSGKEQRELQSAWRLAHKQIKELSLYKNLGIRAPPVSRKTIRFARHPELLGTAEHAEGWSDPDDRDIIYIHYDIWQRLDKNERAALLVHEILESEALKNGMAPDRAHTLAERAEWEADPYRHLDRRVQEILRGEKPGFRFAPAQFLLHDAVKSGMRQQGFDAIAVDETVMTLTLLERFEQAALRNKSVTGHGKIVDLMGWIAGMAGSDAHFVSRFKKEKLYRGGMRMLLGLFGVNTRDLAHSFYQKLQGDKRNWTDILAYFATHYGYLPYKLVEGQRVIAEKDWSAFRLSPEFMVLLEEILFASVLMPWQPPDSPARLQLVQIAPMAQKAWEEIAVPAGVWPARQGSRPRNLWRLFHVPSRGHMQGKLRSLQDTVLDIAGEKMLKPKRWGQLRFLKRVLKGLQAVQGLQAKSIPSMADGTPIHYRVGGNLNAKKTLFFVHGWSGNLYHWIMQIPFFANRYRIILMDLRGHGNTPLAGDPAKFITDLSPRDILSVLEAEGISSGVTLLGHSMGGMVAQELMQQIFLAPEEPAGKRAFKTFGAYAGMFDSLVLLNTTARSPLETSYFGNSRLKPIIHRLLEDLHTWTASLQGSRIEDLFYSLLHPKEEISWIEQWVYQHLLTGENDLAFDYLLPITMQPSRGLSGEPYHERPYRKITYAWKGMKKHDTRKVLPVLGRRMRVLVVHGPGDDFTRLQDVRSDFETIPGVEMYHAEGDRHMAHFERPKMVDEINGRIQEFLETLGGKRRLGMIPQAVEHSMLAPKSVFQLDEHRESLESQDIATREDAFVAMACDPKSRKDLARLLSSRRLLMAHFFRSRDPWIADTAFWWKEVSDYLGFIAPYCAEGGGNPDLLKDFVDFLIRDDAVLADVTAIADGMQEPLRSGVIALLEETLRDARGVPYARQWRAGMASSAGEDVAAEAEETRVSSPLAFRMADLEVAHPAIYQNLNTETLPALHHPRMTQILRDFIPKAGPGPDHAPVAHRKRDDGARQKIRDVFKVGYLPLFHLDELVRPMQRAIAAEHPTEDMLRSDDETVRDNAFIAMACDPKQRGVLIRIVLKDEQLENIFLQSDNDWIYSTMFVWMNVSQYLRRIALYSIVGSDNPPLLRKFVAFLLHDRQLFKDIVAMVTDPDAFEINLDVRALIQDALYDLPHYQEAVAYWRDNVPEDDGDEMAALQRDRGQGGMDIMDFTLQDLQIFNEGLYRKLLYAQPMLQPGNFACDMSLFLPQPGPDGKPWPARLENTPLMHQTASFLGVLETLTSQLYATGEHIHMARRADENRLDSLTHAQYVRAKEAIELCLQNMNRFKASCIEYSQANRFGLHAWLFYDKALHWISRLTGRKPWTDLYLEALRDALVLLPLHDRQNLQPMPESFGLFYRWILKEPSADRRAMLGYVLSTLEDEYEAVCAMREVRIPKGQSALDYAHASADGTIPMTYRKAAQVLTANSVYSEQDKIDWALFLQRQSAMGAGWAEALLKEALEKDPTLKALLPAEKEMQGTLRISESLPVKSTIFPARMLLESAA